MTHILDSRVNQIESYADLGKAEGTISKEEYFSPISNMNIAYKFISVAGTNRCRIMCIRVSMTMDNDQFDNGKISSAHWYMHLENFEEENRFYYNGMSGNMHCNKDTGTMMCLMDCNEIINFINTGFPEFKIEVYERDSQSDALACFHKYVDILRENGHLDLVQPLAPGNTMSPFVRFRAVMVYKTDAAGDVDWHSVEAVSEAFLYNPLPPRVTDLHLLPPDHESSMLTLKLNRSLVSGYDQLCGVTLVDKNGRSTKLDTSQLKLISDRIEVNLGAYDMIGGPPSLASLVGSSCCGVKWQPRPPTKPERQRRVFNPDELDDSFGSE